MDWEIKLVDRFTCHKYWEHWQIILYFHDPFLKTVFVSRMSDSDLEVLEVYLDQDDVMDDLRDVLVQRLEAIEPERVVSFDLPSELVEEVKPRETGVSDPTPNPSQATAKKESRASRRKNRMSGLIVGGKLEAGVRSLPFRKEGCAEGWKRQREEKRARDKVIRSYYGETQPEFEDDDRDLPKESVFSNPGLPADFNDTADDKEDCEQNFSEPEHDDDYSYVPKKYQVKSEVHKSPQWISLERLRTNATSCQCHLSPKTTSEPSETNWGSSIRPLTTDCCVHLEGIKSNGSKRNWPQNRKVLLLRYEVQFFLIRHGRSRKIEV